MKFDPELPQTIRLEFAKSNTKVAKPKQGSPPAVPGVPGLPAAAALPQAFLHPAAQFHPSSAAAHRKSTTYPPHRPPSQTPTPPASHSLTLTAHPSSSRLTGGGRGLFPLPRWKGVCAAVPRLSAATLSDLAANVSRCSSLQRS